MPDGLTYGQPVLPGFPVPPPSDAFTGRVLARLAILHLKDAAVRLKSMEVAALAACLEAASDGDLAEAREALDEAEEMKRIEA